MVGLNFNLLDQLTFYGAYHTNKWNQVRRRSTAVPASSPRHAGSSPHGLLPVLVCSVQLIHFIFVPAIVWSAGVWLAASGPLVPVPLGIRAAAAAALPAWISTWCAVPCRCSSLGVNERHSQLTSALLPLPVSAG